MTATAQTEEQAREELRQAAADAGRMVLGRGSVNRYQDADGAVAYTASAYTHPLANAATWHLR